jgi:sarcosine oxidase subunit beta
VTNVEWIGPEDILKFVPQLRVDDILGGTFCPTDGFVDPHSVMMGFMLNAREKGVRLWLDTTVTGIEVDGNMRAEEARKITGVQTTRGFISTPSSLMPLGPGLRKSQKWPGRNFRLNLCVASSCLRNLSISCRSVFRW